MNLTDIQKAIIVLDGQKYIKKNSLVPLTNLYEQYIKNPTEENKKKILNKLK